MEKKPKTPPSPRADYAIYPHMEVVDGYGWRVGNYDERGALSLEQIDQLAQRSGLPRDVLVRFSNQLGFCLDEDGAINLVEVRRSVAIDRAEATLQTVRAEARHASRKLGQLVDRVMLLSEQFAAETGDRRMLGDLKEQLTAAVAANTQLGVVAEQMLAQPGSAADMSPTDKRKNRDKRRQYVVETCCYAWQDAHREVSYTTRPEAASRHVLQGPLIEFIDHVVPMLTSPPVEIARGTLKKDIDGFRRGQNEPDMFSIPPVFGD